MLSDKSILCFDERMSGTVFELSHRGEGIFFFFSSQSETVQSIMHYSAPRQLSHPHKRGEMKNH